MSSKSFGFSESYIFISEYEILCSKDPNVFTVRTFWQQRRNKTKSCFDISCRGQAEVEDYFEFVEQEEQKGMEAFWIFGRPPYLREHRMVKNSIFFTKIMLCSDNSAHHIIKPLRIKNDHIATP